MIAPGHFATVKREPIGFGVVKRPVPEPWKRERFPVRYGLYSGGQAGIVSNESTALVSLALIETAAYDTMALQNCDVARAAKVALGEEAGSGLDHVNPVTVAVERLGNFPRNETAIVALGKLLDELRNTKEKPRFRVDTVFTAVARVYEDDYGLRILREWVDDVGRPYRVEALKALNPERSGEVIAFLKSVVEREDEELFRTALFKLSKVWAEDEKREKLKALCGKQDLPKVLRRQAEAVYRYSFPNKFVRLKVGYKRTDGRARIELINISSEPIELTWSHLLDLVKPKLEIRNAGELDSCKHFERIVKLERKESMTKTIPPGGSLVLEDQRILHYFEVPKTVPGGHLVLSFETCLPDFGDVPAESASFHLPVKDINRVLGREGL